jgi:hypothetical protein
MASVVDEVFGFWDIAVQVILSLKELHEEESSATDVSNGGGGGSGGANTSDAQRGAIDEILAHLERSNELMAQKRRIFGLPEVDAAEGASGSGNSPTTASSY